jgi:hypothetical protein
MMLPCNKHGVHDGCRCKGYGKPENRTGKNQQCSSRREGPAFSEHPRHSAFECVVHGFFEGLVAYLLPQPRPMPAHDLAPRLARRAGNWQESDDAFEKRRDAVADDTGGEQGKSHDLHQNGERVVKDMDQN